MHLPPRSNTRPDRPRPIQEWHPQQLGVHPAIHGTNAPDTDGEFVLPEYLERDHDQVLRNHLLKAASGEQATLVLVRGASCAGKTRTAFEAVRACLPGWQLVFPKTSGKLLALLDTDALAPRTVLWFNEAQNYLTGADGEEAAAALHSCLEEPGPVVILGTLWPEYHRDLTATPQPGQDTTDAHPSARALLDQAVLVDVPAAFTTEALKNPRVTRDRSLAAAMATSTGGRITQTLAAGPQLVDHYEKPTEPHGPYGHAVITAALDARRFGHTSPLPAALLQAAAFGYLTEQQRAAADPNTWFSHALEYAREKVRGVATALEPVADPNGMGPLPGVYHVSDYLDHHARTTRLYTFPPESFWTAVQTHASTTDLTSLAAAADKRSRKRIAACLYERAADAGDTRALLSLARRRDKAGDTAGAERLYERAADAGDARALLSLARRREQAKDLTGAERLYERAADAGDARALLRLAELREQAGDPAGAERYAQRTADAGNIAVLPAEVPAALTVLAERRWKAGDLAGAERMYEQVANAGHDHALYIMAGLREQAGDPTSAERYAQQASPHVRSEIQLKLAAWREGAGDFAGVERVYRQMDTGGDSLLSSLADLWERAGDTAQAERYAQQATDAGYPRALTVLARRREGAGDTAGAKRLYEQAADAGDSEALRHLARRRKEAGDTAGAKRLYERAADAEHRELLREVAMRPREAGDRVGAEPYAQQAADADHRMALGKLAIQRREAGDRAGVEEVYRQLFHAGSAAASWRLARLREEAGDTAGAERYAQQAANAGHYDALSFLIGLRERSGDVAGAEQLRRFGLEADGSPAQPW